MLHRCTLLSLQDRAFAFARFSLTTDLPLISAPSDIAAAALLLASQPVPLPLGGSGVLSASWRASRGPSEDGSSEAGSLPEGVDLNAPPASVSWCVRDFVVGAMLQACSSADVSAAETCRARLDATEKRLLRSLTAPVPDGGEEAALVDRLMATLNPEVCRGSKAQALLQRQFALERALYKEGKAAARRDVQRVNEAAGFLAATAGVSLELED
jgi:hypothetical protein